MFDQCRVWNRIDRYSLLNEPVEEFAAVPRGPTVESKRVFVEVVVQMLMTDSTVVEFPAINASTGRRLCCRRTADYLRHPRPFSQSHARTPSGMKKTDARKRVDRVLVRVFFRFLYSLVGSYNSKKIEEEEIGKRKRYGKRPKPQ